MKKFLVTCFCLSVLAACNVKETKEYKEVQAERDALLLEKEKENTEMAELMEIIDEVENNFNQIKEAEKYLAVEATNKSEMSKNTKTRVRDNFVMINDILARNKAEIAKLNQRLASSSGNTSGLQKTIDRLTKQIEDKETSLNELKAALLLRDQKIDELETSVKMLAEDVTVLTIKSEEQASRLMEQDSELHAGYYLFGSSKELKDAEIMKGRFLASPKVLKENIKKDKFIRIDIREVSEIPFYSKKAKMYSEHPKDSYEIVVKSDKTRSLRIKDMNKFWSISRFLIVEV